jgi:hypothetical protein
MNNSPGLHQNLKISKMQIQEKSNDSPQNSIKINRNHTRLLKSLQEPIYESNQTIIEALSNNKETS